MHLVEDASQHGAGTAAIAYLARTPQTPTRYELLEPRGKGDPTRDFLLPGVITPRGVRLPLLELTVPLSSGVPSRHLRVPPSCECRARPGSFRPAPASATHAAAGSPRPRRPA